MKRERERVIMIVLWYIVECIPLVDETLTTDDDDDDDGMLREENVLCQI